MSDFIPNSTQVPNLYIDRLMALLSGDEWKVLSYVARRTFGFQKRKDRISANQISDGLVERKTGKRLDYGTGISRGTALKILADLKSYSVLKETAPSIKQKNISTEWALNLDSTTVNWNGLEERQSQKLLINQGRTKRARAKIKSSTLVCGTDQVEQTDLVCGTDQGWSVGQTRGGLWDRPTKERDTKIKDSSNEALPPLLNVGLFDEEDNFADDFKTPPPPPPPPPKAKRKPKKSTEPVDEPVPSEHKEMFGALCTLVGWDWQVLTGEQSGQVAQALGKLRKADYTIEDLRKFYSHWRNNDWRGKQGSYPTLSQVRAEIGKIKLNNNGNGASVSRRIAEL